MAFDDTSKELDVTRLNRNLRRTQEDITWDSGYIRVPVEKGFITDFASIPWYVGWITSNEDFRVIRPAIVHDWLYQNKKWQVKRNGVWIWKSVNRKQADALFDEMLRAEGFSSAMANIIWFGPRIGGSSRWKK